MRFSADARAAPGRAWALLLVLPVAAAAPAFAGGTETLERARESHASGRPEEALPLYLQALQELRAEGDREGAATCLNNASVILHGQGRYAESLELAGEAVAIRRDLGDDVRAGRSLTNAGRALRELGRFGEAEESFRQALALAERAGDPRDQVVNLVNLGVLSQQEGNYGDALQSTRRGLRILEEAGAVPWTARQRLLLLNNQGALYERIGEFQLALEDYREILQLVGDGVDSVPYRVNAATVLRNLGDPNLALEELREAQRLLQAGGGPPALQANLLSNVGIALHRNLGRLDEASEQLRRAFRLAVDSADAGEAMQIGNALAAVEIDRGELDAAARVLRQVGEMLPRGPFLEAAWETHREVGRLCLARGDEDGARRALRTSIALIEGSRRNLETRFEPRRFLRDRIAVYALLADLLAEEGDARAALVVALRARERLLQDPRPAAAPQEGWEEELRELSRAALDAGEAGDGPAMREWQEREDRWAASSRATIPGDVPPGEVIVVYLLSEEHARVFWMAGSSFASAALPPESTVESQATAWLQAVIADEPEEADLGRQLFLAVLGKVLEGVPKDTRLLQIVPDGPLASIPFDALPLAFGPHARLLDRCEVRLSPHLAAGGAPGPLRPPYAFFGPPEDLPDDMPPLPGAEREAGAVRAAAGRRGAQFLGAAATEANLRRSLDGPTGIVHVATHATFDRTDPGGTGIVLQPGDGSPSPRDDDGFLSLTEIGDRPVNADLIFLSACSSAAGEALPGEGVESLGGRLFEAGGRAVIASLWDVDDAAARALVEQFYHRVGRGETLGGALREAKRALRGSGGAMSAPRHWAAWILIGDGDLRVTGKGWRRWLLPAAGIILLVGIVALGVRRLSSRTARS